MSRRADALEGNHVRAGAALMAVAAAVPLLAACQAGPAEVGQGTFRMYASSSGEPVAAAITVDSNAVTMTQGEETTVLPLGESSGPFVVCPPSTQGQLRTLTGTLTVGSLTFEEPAVFGDCGTTAPARITMVDVASVTAAGGPFPFERWVEWCDVTDPDCASAE